MPDPISQLLRPERLTAVLDVGANRIDGEPAYKSMLAAGLCTLTGFEPQAEALTELVRRPNDRYFPDAIGDGSEQTFHICHAPGMSSILEPDADRLALFNLFPAFGKVEKTVRLPTCKLDNIPDLGPVDFLKIDIQGAELTVVRHGKRALSGAVAIQTEVSFVPLYRGQPGFGELDVELRALGFIPHSFAGLKLWPLAPTVINGDPRRGVRQVLEADLVYVRDFTDPKSMTGEQWKQLALIAHHCYGSIDLAVRAITAASEIGACPPGTVDQYMELALSW